MKNKTIKFKLQLLIGFSVVLIALIIFGLSSKNSGSQEKQLSNKLQTVAEDFYENMYYNHITSNKSEEEVNTFLAGFSDMGIKVDLDNLARFDEEKYPKLLEEFVNKKTKDACHIRSTRAIIYPKAPFGNKDYTIETELDCGFGVAEE